MGFLLNMTAGQFIVLFWVLVGLYVVWCVLDGLGKLFGYASVGMILLVLGAYGTLFGMAIFTVFYIVRHTFVTLM